MLRRACTHKIRVIDFRRIKEASTSKELTYSISLLTQKPACQQDKQAFLFDSFGVISN